MPAIVELSAARTVKLPPKVAARFVASDRFLVWVEGDVVYLKRITPSRVTERVANAPKGEPLT